MLGDRAQSGDDVPTQPNNAPWRFKFPNTADSNFNYWILLDNASGSAIARATQQPYIGIIGAGVAGLTATRELFRSGYKNIAAMSVLQNFQRR